MIVGGVRYKIRYLPSVHERLNARQSGAKAQGGMTHSQAHPCSPDS